MGGKGKGGEEEGNVMRDEVWGKREKEKNNGEYGDGDDYREVEEGWGGGKEVR